MYIQVFNIFYVFCQIVSNFCAAGDVNYGANISEFENDAKVMFYQIFTYFYRNTTLDNISLKPL